MPSTKLATMAWSLPHWLNTGLGTSLGTRSTDMAAAVNATVLGFLRNLAIVGPPEGGASAPVRVDLRSIPHTARHSP